MAYASPQASDYQNSPSHSKQHRVFDSDTAAPNQAVCVDADGNVGVKTNAPTKELDINGDLKADNITTGGITLDALAATTDLDIGSHKMKAEMLESDVASGTAPLVVASNTKVNNLNADKIDGYDVSAYSGGQSYTFPGGLVMKMGHVTSSSPGATVTFATAFPNGVISVITTSDKSTTILDSVTVAGATASKFDWAKNTSTPGFHWLAIGN